MQLQVIVSAVDQLTAPLRNMGRAVSDFGVGAMSLGPTALKPLEGALRSGNAALAEHQEKWRETSMVARQAGMVMAGAGAAIVGGFVAAGIASAKYGSEIQDMSSRTGMSAEALTALKYAADQTGASLESVQMAVKGLSRNALAAMQDPASEAGKAFASIGVSVTDAAGKLKSTETLFVEVGDALRGVKNETERTALATQLLGRGGMMLLPMFTDAKNSLSGFMDEAKRLGLVVSQDTIGKLDNLDDTLARLKMQGAMAFRIVGAVAVPVLQVVGDFLSWVSAKTSWLANTFPLLTTGIVLSVVAFGALLATLGPLLYIIPGVVDGFIFLKGALGAEAVAAGIARVQTFAAGVSARIAGAWAAVSAGGWNAVAAAMMNVWKAAGPVVIAVAAVVAVILAAVGAAANMVKVFNALKEGRWQDALKLEANNISPLLAIKNGIAEVGKLWTGLKAEFADPAQVATPETKDTSSETLKKLGFDPATFGAGGGKFDAAAMMKDAGLDDAEKLLGDAQETGTKAVAAQIAKATEDATTGLDTTGARDQVVAAMQKATNDAAGAVAAQVAQAPTAALPTLETAPTAAATMPGGISGGMGAVLQAQAASPFAGGPTMPQGTTPAQGGSAQTMVHEFRLSGDGETVRVLTSNPAFQDAVTRTIRDLNYKAGTMTPAPSWG